jgi:hypothetical protein
MFPSPSNFNSVNQGDWWWQYARDDGTTNVCASTGWMTVQDIRTALGLDTTPSWDATLQAGLIQAAGQWNDGSAGWGGLIQQLQQDAASQQVSRVSCTFGLYVAYYHASGWRLDAISVPANAILPVFGAPMTPRGASQESDAIVCWNPASDPNPFTLGTGDFITAQGQSNSGVRLHPGESLPAGFTPPGTIAGLSTGQLVAAGVGVALFVYAVTKVSGPVSASSSPHRLRYAYR